MARRWLAAAPGVVGGWGRRLGLLPHRPERWTTEQWTAAYGAGQLRYYAELEELARYSVIIGYIAWAAGANPGRPPTLLDVGCGTGLLRERLEGVAFSSYVGIDLSDTAIERAASVGHDRSRFVVGDATALDLGRFDVVVLNEVLYYAPDPGALLRRVEGALAPGGVLVVSMWRHPGDRSLWREVDRALPTLDRVHLRNPSNRINPRGWWVSAHRAPDATTG